MTRFCFDVCISSANACFENCALTFRVWRHNDSCQSKKNRKRRKRKNKENEKKEIKTNVDSKNLIRNFQDFVCACYVFDMWDSTLNVVVLFCYACGGVWYAIQIGFMTVISCDRSQMANISHFNNTLWLCCDSKKKKLTMLRKCNASFSVGNKSNALEMSCVEDKRSILHLSQLYS